jgi:hypothetical protein
LQVFNRPEQNTLTQMNVGARAVKSPGRFFKNGKLNLLRFPGRAGGSLGKRNKCE